ncbi:MAG: serine/threonine-protein kinase [Gemmatimonadota bacterium]
MNGESKARETEGRMYPGVSSGSQTADIAETEVLLRQVSRLLAPDYEIDAQLGRGGMAVVYAATHNSTRQRVAIKVLPPQLASTVAAARERFVREARLAAALIHPGIVPVHAAAIKDDIAYFVMALVEGESLAQRLMREPRLSTADARLLLAEIADALRCAHSAGVMHRDIKPDNILIEDPTGRAMLSDFGIARVLDDTARLTREDVIVGTPEYMSPEQARGDADIDHRADIYSLGIVGYEILAGHRPFLARNAMAVLAKHVNEPLPPLLASRPDVPPDMVYAIERALEKQPEDRWDSASDFLAALGGLPSSPERAQRYPSASVRAFTIAEQRADYAKRRLGRFRRQARASLGVTGGLGIMLALLEADTLPAVALVSVPLVGLVIEGARLYADGIPVSWMLSVIFNTGDTGPERALPDPRERYAARCEVARRGAANEVTEIRRLLETLSEHDRPLITHVDATVAALLDDMEALTEQLLTNTDDAPVHTDTKGETLLKLDSVVDAMYGIRLDLMEQREKALRRGASTSTEASDEER